MMASSYNGQGITVTGSGADIWGTADQFHFVWQHMNGDFSIDTRVDSLAEHQRVDQGRPDDSRQRHRRVVAARVDFRLAVEGRRLSGALNGGRLIGQHCRAGVDRAACGCG